MNKECVFDGSTANLNTSMTIKLDDGTKVEVFICDGCAEDATIGKAKSAYISRYSAKQKEIEALMAKAKELGLTLVMPGATVNDEPKAEPKKPVAKEPETIKPKKGNVVVNSAEADRLGAINPAIRSDVSNVPYGESVGGVSGEYAINSEHKASENLREGEVAEMAVVEGRQGMPIKIPVAKRGKMGTTNIRVNNTMTDRQLQARFKNMANQDSDNGHSYKESGYDARFITCPLCRGDGEVRGQQCPKCKGDGGIWASGF